MRQKQEKQIYIEIVKILKILSHIVSYDERSREQYKKYDELNNNINNSYKYMIKMLEDNKYNMYILNSYEICNMIKDILYIYDKNIECIICKVKSAYNLKTTYLKIKILDKWYNLDFANCIYELRANTRPLFFLVNDDVMQRLQNISYETESIEKYMKECISLYNFEDVLDKKYNMRDNNIKTLAFKKIEWPYPEYHNIYEKILLKPLDYFLSSSLDTYDDLKELIGILKEKYLYNVYDVIQKEVFLKKNMQTVHC